MAFPVTCPSCGKAFQLATDIYERKVAGKVVSIKCKQCQSGIRVDATVPGQLKVLGTTPASAGTDSRRPPAPSIHEEPAPMRARQPTLLGMTAPSSPSSTGAGAAADSPDGPLWAVDSGGAGEDRELNDAQIAREISSGKLTPNTLVWREGFGDWLEIANVPQLAQHLPGAKKPGLPPRAAAKSAPLNPAPGAAKPASAPLNPAPRPGSAPNNPAPKPASAPINPAPAAKSPALGPAAAKAAPAVPKATPKAAPVAAKAGAPAPKAGEPRAPQRSAPLIDPPPAPAPPAPPKVDLGLEDDEDATMIYRAPTDLVAQLASEEKHAAPPPAAGRPAIARPPAPKAAPAAKAAPAPPPLREAPPAAPPLPAAPPPRAAPPLPAKAATVSPLPAPPAPPPLPSLPADAEPTFSEPMPAPTISAEPEPPLQSAQPFPVLSAQPIAARPLDPSIPVKGLEFPPAPRVPQGALPAQAAAPFGAPTPGVTPTNAPPGMGMLAPNPFATMPTTTDLEFPSTRSKVPYVVAALLGVAAVAGIVAVIMTSKEPPPPVPVPVAVPAEKVTSAVPAAQTAAPAETANTAPGAPDPVANPTGTPGGSSSGNFSQMFAAGVESASKSGAPVAANTPFDAEAAKKAVFAQLIKVAACKEAGSPLGQTSAAITFDPSGKVSAVTVGAPFAGTSTGTCMVTSFKEVQVAPFTGLPATVNQAVSLR